MPDELDAMLRDIDEPETFEDRIDNIEARLTDIQRTLGWLVQGVVVCAVLLLINIFGK